MGIEKIGKSFQYVVNGVPKWVAAGIFGTPHERKAAERFPLFGRRPHDPVALHHIVKKYRLNEVDAESIGLSVRTAGCLKRAGIITLDTVLMMYPFQLLKIQHLGSKSVHELQQIAQIHFEIELEISQHHSC